MKNAIKTSVTLATIALALQSPTASAIYAIPGRAAEAFVDAKTFNGTECQPAIGAQSAALNYSGGVWGGVTNASAGTIYVVCPLVRDDADGPNGLPAGVVVWGSANLSCAWQSRNPVGTIVGNATRAGAVEVFAFGSVVPKAEDGTYDLYCQMQPGSMLYGYELQEQWVDDTVRTDKRL